METIIILAIIYLAISSLLKKYPILFDLNKIANYRKEYFENVKKMFSAKTEQEILELNKKTESLFILLMKENFKFLLVSFGLFLAFYLILEPQKEFSKEPTAQLCLTNDSSIIYEDGKFLKSDIFEKIEINEKLNVSYYCPKNVLYLPFPIFNLKYIIGDFKIFIFFVILISIMWMIFNLIIQNFKNIISKYRLGP
jgi:hypothetical protein